MREHAIDSIWRFLEIFKKKNPAFERGLVRGGQCRAEQREIAAQQRTASRAAAQDRDGRGFVIFAKIAGGQGLAESIEKATQCEFRQIISRQI